jgi:DNA-binding protein HU-beta
MGHREKKQMNKTEMTRELARVHGISINKAGAIVDSLFDGEHGMIARAVARGERVALQGFGVFEASERNARTGRNPHTGEELHIPAATFPKFKAGRTFKDTVNR